MLLFQVAPLPLVQWKPSHQQEVLLPPPEPLSMISIHWLAKDEGTPWVGGSTEQCLKYGLWSHWLRTCFFHSLGDNLGQIGLDSLSSSFFICDLDIVKSVSKKRFAFSINGVPSTQLLKTKFKDCSWHLFLCPLQHIQSYWISPPIDVPNPSSSHHPCCHPLHQSHHHLSLVPAAHL